jgi:hypothetical protein
MTASSYKKMEREAALRFLQTAVVVDDAATMNREAEEAEVSEDSRSKEIATPGMEAAVRASAGQGGGHSHGPPPVLVDVKVISSTLADEGITCGILRPTPDESDSEIENRVVNACSRVDLVVVDWVLDSGRSLSSRDAIARIVKEDQRGSRVIAVYTSEEALHQIAEELLEAVPDAKRIAGRDMMIQAGGTRIALFRKSPSGAKTVKGKKAYCEKRLAERIIEIFVEAVQGWVRAIALHGMAAVRENVHHILDRLDPSLDMGYAGNLLRMEHLEDGPEQILDSIGGEFGSVIHDDAQSQQIADRQAFAAWAEHRDSNGKMAVSGEEIRFWTEATDGGQIGEAKSRLITDLKSRNLISGKGDFDRKVTRLFFDDFDGPRAEKADIAFAMLLSLRYLYGDARRTLHLGTVLQDEKNKEFWLCVQPVCDSVRLGGQAGFPLLRLKKGKPGKKSQICFPVRTGEGTEMLSSTAKADEIEVVQFDPDPASERVVFKKSTSDSERHTIRSADGTAYVWLAELKTAHSNRVAHKLGEQLARVGLDESVWLSEQVA